MSNENMIQLIPNDSEYESDVSSIADSSTANVNESKMSCEHLTKRMDSLSQENRVLQVEVQTYKLRLKSAQHEIKQLKHASVNMQVKTEQEEEFISNTLFKKIHELKKEKETLANNYEREEEFLTNDLTKKLQQIRDEKHSLEQSLECEQASQISQLMKRINRLEAETTNKQNTLEQLKREKIELENTLEKEQESLVNRLWKRMEKLETDKKLLQLQIQQPHSTDNPSSSNDLNERTNLRSHSLYEMMSSTNRPVSLNVDHAEQLKREVERLRQELVLQQDKHQKKLKDILQDDQNARNENLRLQRKLQVEVDRREQLYRQLSESESSLEMDEERALNQKIKSNSKYEPSRISSSSSSSSQHNLARSRTASSPAFTLHQTFYDGSHRCLIDLLHRTLSARSILVTLPGTKWPWRARCSALILSDLIPKNETNTLKYLFSSSIVNLSELISLRSDLRSLKTIIYFHENDLAYPKQNEQQEQRDFQYGYNQILTALVADICLFNSLYNLNTFLDKLGPFLNRIPSPKANIQDIRQKIQQKSQVFYYPLEKSLVPIQTNTQRTGPLCIVWPHRWEHDKDPDTFFSVVLELYQTHSLIFSLIILGQSYGEQPAIFSEIQSKLPSNYIRHWGFAQSKVDYEQLLLEGDVVVSTAQHEFFGVAMLEAWPSGITRIQLLNKLKEYCQKPDYVRYKTPKQDTTPFEWETNENIREKYLQLFQ
ncbi:hypothetical protein I4U23_015066 [Adineta vaga]|nr:hypothetical protein I4U23_015066 [Adineta vaga]